MTQNPERHEGATRDSDFVKFLKLQTTGQFNVALQLRQGVEMIRKILADLKAGNAPEVLPGMDIGTMLTRAQLIILFKDMMKEGLAAEAALKLFNEALIDAIRKHKVKVVLGEADVNNLLTEAYSNLSK